MKPRSRCVGWSLLVLLGMSAPAWPAQAQTCTDKTAVVVYFVGLMVFERKPAADPTELVVHVPNVVDHTIHLYTGQGDPATSGLEWIPTGIQDSKVDLTLALPSSPPLNLNPQDLLRARELNSNMPQLIDPKLATLSMKFTRGDFETCSMVLNDKDELCKVQFGDTKRDQLAETMVLTIPIDCADTIEIKGHTESVVVEPIRYASPPHFPGFERTFEIALTNVYDTVTGRVLTTHHSEHLKNMFKSPKGTWSPTTAYDCKDVTRTPCFDHFASYLPRFSGYNRPICPLIEGP